jgi:hypothetical protein
MPRYHIKVFMPYNIKNTLKDFNDNINMLKWQYSEHCIDNLKNRVYNIKDILLFISQLKLDYNDIFELYTNDKNEIIKACYRIISHAIFDLILVISNSKKIITLYANSKDDEHITLNKNLYARG